MNQHTLRNSFSVEGKGIHTGKKASLTVNPAPENTGILFQRMDLPYQPFLKANVKYVKDTSRGTTIGNENFVIRTVEHLLAALKGCRVDNAIIQIDNEEVPILDGSSRQYVELIQKVGLLEQQFPKTIYHLKEPIEFHLEEQNVHYLLKPSQNFSIETTISYNHGKFLSQQITMHSLEDFCKTFYNARTFAFLSEIRPLLEKNLIRGGDLQSAIVFVDKKLSEDDLNFLRQVFRQYDINVLSNGVLNNVKLLYEDEPVRHKTLDILGDLALVGVDFWASIKAIRPSHKHNVYLAGLIQKQIENYYGIEIA
ncbi:MAG: UDP-3-O-acyl-N-acetylglucosamine deacetylase [Bacteroidales bacterium]|nr:UDP-3-O-acyl-N-acetylglucosamine deacetylase [Bacteroidales bacterium]